MITLDDFKDYCTNNGLKPSHAMVLHKFVEDITHDRLVKCECCGEIVEEEYTKDSSGYDNPICEQCKKDGN